MVSVLILGLDLHMEDPEIVKNAVNIFMLPDLYLAAGTEAVLVVQRWDTALDSNTLTPYAKISALMKNQRIYPIVGWEGAVKMLDQWLVMINVILGPPELHPAVHEIRVLVEVA